MKKYLTILVLVFFFIPYIIFSQVNSSENNIEKINLKGKHSIGVNLGVINQTSEVTIDIRNISNRMNFQASLSYNYWFTNELAIEANAGYLGSSLNNNIEYGGVEQKTAAVIPYYLGAKYYPAYFTISGNIRPFVMLLAGAVTGHRTQNIIRFYPYDETFVTETAVSETVFSAKSGIGADAFISKSFKLGLTLDYLYMPDFNKSVGTRKNYSGVNLTFGFGVMF
jgi:outer membrane protein W